MKFETAWIYVEMQDDHGSATAEEVAIAPDLFYRTLDNKYVYRFADNELVNKVYDLCTEFQSTGKQPLTTFSYALAQDNKFSIDFSCDDIKPDDENCEARKALWIKEHLGDVEIDYPK